MQKYMAVRKRFNFSTDFGTAFEQTLKGFKRARFWAHQGLAGRKRDRGKEVS
jgi:hypothetical protein